MASEQFARLRIELIEHPQFEIELQPAIPSVGIPGLRFLFKNRRLVIETGAKSIDVNRILLCEPFDESGVGICQIIGDFLHAGLKFSRTTVSWRQIIGPLGHAG
jgi:hypothetical protein